MYACCNITYYRETFTLGLLFLGPTIAGILLVEYTRWEFTPRGLNLTAYCAGYFLLSTLLLQQSLCASRPHVIIIIADDLGWNDISLHGSPQIPTPNIDRLSQEGITLNNYYTMHLCSPTRGSLLTGRHAMQLGLQRFVITETTPFGLGLNETILPQYLKPLGYSTHLVGKWHQGFFAKELTPLYRGFDTFYGFLTSHESYYDHRCYCSANTDGGKDGYDFRNQQDLDLSDNDTYSTYLYTRRAQKIIQEHDKSKPMLLYVAQQAVHTGFGSKNPQLKRPELEAPPDIIDKFSYIESKGRRTFAAMTYLLDESIGNITRTLRQQRMLSNSIIIFASDNGGPTMETSENYASNWPLRGAKASYWQGGVRAGAFIWSPLIKKRSVVFNGLVHVTDWLPTILHAVSGRPPKAENLYGMSMWPSFVNGTRSPRQKLVINWDMGTGAIILDRHKLVVLGEDKLTARRSDWYKPVGVDVSKVNFTVKCPKRDNRLPQCNATTSPCLYDIATDPCEYNNIAQKMPKLVENLYAKLKKFANAAQPPRNCPDYKWADPAYHGGAWVPYMHLNSTRYDRVC